MSRDGRTHLVIRYVRDMNRLGISVDLTHTGEWSSPDAIAFWDDPVVLLHPSGDEMRDNPCNYGVEQMKALASKGTSSESQAAPTS